MLRPAPHRGFPGATRDRWCRPAGVAGRAPCRSGLRPGSRDERRATVARAVVSGLACRRRGGRRGETALAELLIDEVAAQAGVECQIGIADGLFAATLAARRAALVPAGEAATFLAPLPITELNQPGDDRVELVGLLRRLGLRTLGA